LAARRLAISVLRQVLEEHRALDEALAAHADLERLAARDRAFARLLIATSLRRLPEIDAILKGFLSWPLPAKANEARWVLRLGAVQILLLKTPAHAAVSTSLALLEGRMAGFKGLANAVLRKLGRDARPLASPDAARLNTPDWLWQSWSDAYGEATALAIAEQHLENPPLDLTVPDEPAGWADRLGGTLLPQGGLRLRSAGDPQALAGYADGAWWVQDQAAALPVLLFPDLRGRRIADLCAAPGGKTLQLAAAGAQVTALDLSEERLARVHENLARCGLEARLQPGDACDWQPPEPLDAVLLDAPCSATGTLRRHPDIARNRRQADVESLLPLQARLLRAAVAMLRPGGVLIYTVCSLQPEEGAQQIEALLAESKAVRRLAISAEELAGHAEMIDVHGALRTLPCHLAEAGGMDGFYAARLERLA